MSTILEEIASDRGSHFALQVREDRRRLLVTAHNALLHHRTFRSVASVLVFGLQRGSHSTFAHKASLHHRSVEFSLW